jgi:hypothetical protein
VAQQHDTGVGRIWVNWLGIYLGIDHIATHYTNPEKESVTSVSMLRYTRHGYKASSAKVSVQIVSHLPSL